MPHYEFDPAPHPARRSPPPGSCDSQFHVLGSREQYPVRDGAAYEMPNATIDAALRMHRTLGIERGVIVQSTTYGSDHRALLDGLALAGPGYRGCAVAAVLDVASERELDALHVAGVRGARFNLLRELGFASDRKAFARAAGRLAELGWYAKIQPGANGILESIELFEDFEIPVVVDHFGRPNLEEDIDGPTVGKMVELLERGNFWVMLSNGHKLSRQRERWLDVVPLARRYIEAAPERVIWGSDWPHPVSTSQPPNDGALLDLAFRYAASEEELDRLLVRNPADLFGFDENVLSQ
jgi:predicted TIM-barrel fold metal-dependent hydrolase